MNTIFKHQENETIRYYRKSVTKCRTTQRNTSGTVKISNIRRWKPGNITSITFDIFQTRCNNTQFIYFSKTALRVSGGISTHHQENTQLYLQYLVLFKSLLLPSAVLEELELVSLWCGNCIDLFWCGCNRTKTDQYNFHITLKPVPTLPQ